jgi:hypothetical protein
MGSLVFPTPFLVTKLEGSAGIAFELIDPVTREVQLSSESFAPTYFPAGTELLAVRLSPLAQPVTNPQLTLHYREVLA